MEKRTFTVVDYVEIDRLISSEFGIDYECVCEQEWGNDECHIINVEPEELDSYDRRKFDKGEYSWMLRGLLNELCKKEKIEAGAYLVKISW